MAITVFGQRREIDGDHIHELMFPGHKRFFQPNAIKDLVDDFATHLEKEIERTVRRVQEKGGEEIVGAHSLVYECVVSLITRRQPIHRSELRAETKGSYFTTVF